MRSPCLGPSPARPPRAPVPGHEPEGGCPALAEYAERVVLGQEHINITRPPQGSYRFSLRTPYNPRIPTESIDIGGELSSPRCHHYIAEQAMRNKSQSMASDTWRLTTCAGLPYVLRWERSG